MIDQLWRDKSDAIRRAVRAAKGWEFARRVEGEYTSESGMRSVDGLCPDCGDDVSHSWAKADGWSFTCRCELAAGEAASAAWIEEHGATMAALLWEQAKTIPPRYRPARFSSFRPRSGTDVALTRCTQWSASFDRRTSSGIFLVGPFGSGKTHLAVATAYAALERSLIVPHFCSAAHLAATVKSGDGLNMAPVNAAVSASLLVLDDLGQTGRTEFDREIVYRIVSERYERRRPLIATSNLTDARLADVLGGALVSRLYEMAEMAVLTASDYRKAQAQTQDELRLA